MQKELGPVWLSDHWQFLVHHVQQDLLTTEIANEMKKVDERKKSSSTSMMAVIFDRDCHVKSFKMGAVPHVSGRCSQEECFSLMQGKISFVVWLEPA